MHTLLQQFQDMNQMHDLDHCEISFKDAAKAAYEQAKATAASAAEKAKAAAAAAKAAKDGAVAAHKQHAEEVKTQKEKDDAIITKWNEMDMTKQKEVLKQAVDKTSTSRLKDWFFSDATTKQALLDCIDSA